MAELLSDEEFYDAHLDLKTDGWNLHAQSWMAEREARKNAEAENARLREALKETLDIAARNEDGPYVRRALVALGTLAEASEPSHG